MRTTPQRLPLHLQFVEDLIVVNKPAGISSHSVDRGKLGMAEIIEQELLARGIEKKVHVVHRLDKSTTGTMVFATSADKARELFTFFKEHKVKKRYVLLTAANVQESEFSVFSKIEMIGKKIVNTPCSADQANAETWFKKVKLNAFFQQWEAFPKTGKPHQIRLHASQVGIPILGDTLYGGEGYPHLCLHAQSLEIPGYPVWTSFHPVFFERMGLLRDRELAKILSAFDRRERLFNFFKLPAAALRLSHTDNPYYRIDLFADVMWVYWYAEPEPDLEELERFEFLATLMKRKIVVRKMQNRGKNPNEISEWSFQRWAESDLDLPPENYSTSQLPAPGDWQAQENGISYELRSKQGLSPGLFLDQRENRWHFHQISPGKRVLNLFSYTCGFSVAAALGGARETISVDLSKAFLQWGEKNFQLNGIDARAEGHLFFAQDSLHFLKQTEKKKKTFDLIICDPPSFSRNANKTWQIEKDLPELLQSCWNCLGSGGTLLISTNYEKWGIKDLQNAVMDSLNIDENQMRIPALQPWDYELPNEPTLMKALLVTR